MRREASLIAALLPILVLIALLTSNVFLFEDTLSGAKISPLSDTTNLAPAMAGTDIFTHIQYMFYTTIPSLSIALIIFLVIGFNSDF